MQATRTASALGLALAALLALGAMHWRAFEPLERMLLDAGFRLLRAHRPQSLPRDVALIGIDEATFERLREPFALWHPHLGRLLSGLARARPAAVGLDIVLPDRAYHFLLPGWDQPLLAGLSALRAVAPVVIARSINEHGSQRRIFPPYLSIVGAKGVGAVTACRDDDHVVRRVDEAGCAGAQAEPSLAGRMAAHLGVERSWRGLIDYAIGDPVEVVPMHRALEWIERGDDASLRAAFGGRPVMIGVVLPYTDRHVLPVALAAFEPVARILPGVLVHVQALRSMLGRGLVEPVAPMAQMALAALAALFWLGASGWRKWFAWTIALGALALAQPWVLWKGMHLAAAHLAAIATLALLARQVYDAHLQARERRLLRGTFGHYVSPDILRAILAGRIPAGLSGTRRSIGVLFCDLRGFTRRVEGLPPQTAVRLLNRFFDAATEAVQRRGGMTNKFLGDGLLALFGAPQPLPNPAKQALEAAQEVLDGVARLNRALAAEGVAPFEPCIGIHLGEAVVGNIGATTHQEYTAVGETVNLAAALERAARAADYPVLCSAAVAQAVGGAGGLVPLGARSLGTGEPIEVHGWRPALLAGVPAREEAR